MCRAQYAVKVLDVTVHKPNQTRQGPFPFHPPPLVGHEEILLAGFALTLSAYLWLPSVLVWGFLASLMIPYTFRQTDDGSERRRMHRKYLDDPSTPIHLRTVPDDVILEENFWTNPRGMLLCTSIMMPRYQPIKAVVCYCHGYSDNASHLTRHENLRLVREGNAVVAIEYEGHGRSDGPSGLIYDWHQTVGDVVSFFEATIRTRFPRHKIFLMGESMGGAIAFCTYRQRPDLFSGVVFVAPMCKISDAMKPADWVVDIFKVIAGPQGANRFLGYLPITPAKSNLKDVTFKMPEIRDLANSCPTAYGRNPRLTTARELLLATFRISEQMKSFDAPFLVLHGKDDHVTDPALSQELYKESRSRDKAIRLYEGMWHSITSGECEENKEKVFQDIVNWISMRA